ncbi:hypothetical protein [Ramlibacter sp.]|uniref:hypothetical protein n=1 Tax=Ramlibacter sp. TaxID=1917967 RepID=UPI002B8F8C67|nr:hypothetical protein [Ramlibacter sp.]HWI82336.1 hypothetical protein [Ramlibacter sp.]
MNQVTAPGRVPPEHGQHKEEPEQAMEDDIPSDDHDADGTQPGEARAPDGDQVRRGLE